MKHLYEESNFGENWFDYAAVYSRFVAEIPDNGKLVEVGCWKGKSVCYFAVEAINSGKTISIDAVDTWKGSAEHAGFDCVKNDTLYQIFLDNIKPVNHMVKPIRMNSPDASSLYEDESVDIVFLDAAHDYDSVLIDIKSWLPKVKSGGILAGHDFNNSWVGVINAVTESLYPFEVQGPCWIYYKR